MDGSVVKNSPFTRHRAHRRRAIAIGTSCLSEYALPVGPRSEELPSALSFDFTSRELRPREAGRSSLGVNPPVAVGPVPHLHFCVASAEVAARGPRPRRCRWCRRRTPRARAVARERAFVLLVSAVKVGLSRAHAHDGSPG